RDERHAEHREEVGRRPARLDVERAQPGALRLYRRGAAGHHRRTIRLRKADEVLGVAPRRLIFRLLVRALAARRARIELHVVEIVTVAGDRIDREHVPYGQRRHARANAERDRDDHQHGQPDVALEAAPREIEVVRQHYAFTERTSDGPRSRSAAVPSTMWMLRCARAAISGSCVTITT